MRRAHGPPAFWLGAGILLVLGLLAGPAQAQRRQRPYFQIYDWFGKAAFDTRFDWDDRTSTEEPDVRQTERRFGEEFTLGGKGWIYHPALARFTAEAGFRFEQEFEKTEPGARSVDTNRTRLNYDLHLEVLPDKPYPITLFGSQINSDIDTVFAPRRTIDTLRYGGGFQLRELDILGWKVPSRLLYRHQDTDTNAQEDSSDSRRVWDEVELVMRNRTEHARNRLEYDWESLTSEVGSIQRKTQRSDFRLFQDLRLGEGRLDSRLWLSDETGTRQARTATITEALSLIHSPRLSSNYNYSFSYQDTEGLSQMSHTLGASVSHQYYESISSSAQVSGSYFDSDRGVVLQAGAGGRLGYTKKIPGGRLGLRVQPSFNYQDDQLDGSLQTVLGERHPVVIGRLIQLEQPFVTPDTIVVIDPDTLTEFIEGRDYTVVPIGIRSAVNVLPGSDLDPDVAPFTKTIEIRYEFKSQPARTFTTTTVESGFSLNLWEHVSFDVSYDVTNQKLLKGIEEDSTLDSSRLLLARLDLTFPHNRTHLEYEKLRSQITPRIRYRISHTIDWRPTRRSSLGLSVGYDFENITDRDRTSEVYFVSGNATAWLARNLLARLNLLGRRLSQVEDDTLSAGGTLTFVYRYGRLRFELENRADWRRTDRNVGTARQTEEIVTSVFFRVTRDF